LNHGRRKYFQIPQFGTAALLGNRRELDIYERQTRRMESFEIVGHYDPREGNRWSPRAETSSKGQIRFEPFDRFAHLKLKGCRL